MEASKIESLIIAQDWSVLDHVGDLGPGGVPMLTRLLENPDPEVRKLVILCLEHIKAPQVATTLAQAINDPDEQVRSYAIDILRTHPDPSVLPAMKSALAKHEDPRIRAKVALVIGIIGDRGAQDWLRKALASEPEPEVRDGVQQAMARLGDPEARTAILKQLGSPDKKTEFEAFGKIEYINDRALVKTVAALLGDPAPLLVLTASNEASVTLRLNDAAAKTIAVLLQQPFSFKLTSYRVCTDAEIQEIQAYLRKASRAE